MRYEREIKRKRVGDSSPPFHPTEPKYGRKKNRGVGEGDGKNVPSSANFPWQEVIYNRHLVLVKNVSDVSVWRVVRLMNMDGPLLFRSERRANGARLARSRRHPRYVRGIFLRSVYISCFICDDEGTWNAVSRTCREVYGNSRCARREGDMGKKKKAGSKGKRRPVSDEINLASRRWTRNRTEYFLND